MVLFFVNGCTGVEAVGSLGVIRATQGWTFSIIRVGKVGMCGWLRCCGNVQVLQKADEKLLLVVLELLLVDTVLSHGFIHGRDHGRHLGDNGRKGRDFSYYCLCSMDT